MDTYESIFVESNEDMGILYRSYYPLVGITSDFLNTVADHIKILLKDPLQKNFNLNPQIEEFKSKTQISFSPDSINPSAIRQTFRDLKRCNQDLEGILGRYVKLKDNIAYGGNYMRAIIKKPKVYSKTTNYEDLDRINNNIRHVNRAMDWIEKVIIDLFNLNDQDRNILEIVNKIYIKKHIYESSQDPDDYSTTYTEAFNKKSSAYWSGECNAFWSYFNVDLNRLGDIKKPDEKVTIRVGSKDMIFKTAIGNKPGRNERMDHYTSVPTAIHHFNVNRSLICNDRVGIDRAIVHYFKFRDRSYNNDNMGVDDYIKKFNVKPKKLIFNPYGSIGLTFSSNLSEDGFGIIIDQNLVARDGEKSIIYVEAANDGKPESDHPIRDTLMDLDQKTTKVQQQAKKTVQEIQNVGRAAIKPIKRTGMWVQNMINKYHQMSETQIKEKLADPNARSGLHKAIRWTLKYGSMMKAGLLFNIPFMLLYGYHKKRLSDKEKRIKNEMINELRTEMEIIDEKINHAKYKHDMKAESELRRLKNEVNKKMLRVGGTKDWAKII